MNHSEAGKLGYKKTRYKLVEYRKNRSEESKSKYNNNPKYCINCKNRIDYKKRNNKFCSRSCSASFNNIGVVRNGKSKDFTNTEIKHKNTEKVNKYCFTCGSQISKTAKKYCSQQCRIISQWELKKHRIESGLVNSSKALKKYIIEKRGIQCEICKTTDWMGKNVPLILDHIDGKSENNSLDNLRLVCGNCDMQLPTYKSKNRGNGRTFRRRRYLEGKSY